jgi:superfamily I DNA and/or RNA helicase
MRLRQWVDRGKLTISSEERTLLATAATWVKSSPPPGKFLEELAGLRDRLLQKCAPDKRPLRIREKARADVSVLLSEAVEAANRQLRESDEGLALILDDYLRDLEGDPRRVLDALRTYSVVAAETCQGSGRLSASANSPSGSEGFETVIVDEAARANPLDLFIPMAQARRRIILVGDHRQLPQILDPALEKELKASQSEDTERYISTSLFEKLFKEMRVREKQDLIPRTITLDTQFRMGSKLGRFVSEQFYEKHDEPQLLTGIIDEDKLRHGIGRFTKNGEECVAAWIDVPGDQGFEESGASRRRPVEARRVIRELKLLCEESPDLSVGVISFYSAQVALISKLLETSEFARTHPEWRNHQLQIGTVDSFQGLEFDVVILSMTRSNRPWQSPRAGEPLSVEELELLIRRRYGFLCLENRACVALSRQKRLLIVIGDSRMVDCPEAEKVIPALAAFYKLCSREPYGIYL